MTKEITWLHASRCAIPDSSSAEALATLAHRHTGGRSTSA